jgi:hypothetical protein
MEHVFGKILPEALTSNECSVYGLEQQACDLAGGDAGLSYGRNVLKDFQDLLG